MPIPLIVQGVTEGLSSIPFAWTILKLAPWVLLVAALKFYFGGARNASERVMHSKVVMITGGTSGIGAQITQALASRGAQIVLLTQHSPSDIFLVEYIEDLRKSTNNQLIYAEQVDLSSLHSIRTFATKWIDNVTPRRLDMVILCASTNPPPSHKKLTTDGLDEEWQVNYLANFHLLSILSPALRAQPAHRDVRIIFAGCSASYIRAGGFDLRKVEEATNLQVQTLQSQQQQQQQQKVGRAGAGAGAGAGKGKKTRPNTQTSTKKPESLFALSKLSLMVFAHAFQKHLNAFKRPDGQPTSTRVIMVDPGFTRTPGMRRWMTGGSLWGLLVYLVTWPVWWLVLKSPQQGAQSFLYAAMEARYGRDEGGWMIKECREVDVARKEIRDEAAGKLLWEFSEKMIEVKEKESAVQRALAKKEAEQQEAAEQKAGPKAQTPGSRRSRKGNGSGNGK
ncbi:putative oxidoreductase [Aspergillus saccharolyticus JOP 1030-1]|uniref:NAD(P)-binding protein n=1 Tax=Aspergillus saccharolyticus JOP 1030-1 TaxID=1450539 RepID=A0A318ZQ50_9EURO|nr:NAD(P)-binding protein [Aspergillus saccharolyticus JOP 1030-1]PYH49636.1 NAD(P)-binding protein [Aspergillus saccharolyticus JOP 1030-1]